MVYFKSSYFIMLYISPSEFPLGNGVAWATKKRSFSTFFLKLSFSFSRKSRFWTVFWSIFWFELVFSSRSFYRVCIWQKRYDLLQVTIFTISFSRNISIMLNQIPFSSAQSFSRIIENIDPFSRKQRSKILFSRKDLSKILLNTTHHIF